MKKIFYTLIIAFAGFSSFAQSELSLPMFKDVFQSSYINPVVRPEFTTSIGLPGVSGIYGQFIFNGTVPSNVFEERNNEIVLLPDQLLKESKDKNLFHANFNADIFHLRFKSNNWFYWFGARLHSDNQFTYAKDLIGLAVQGNGAYIGKTIDLSNTTINLSQYLETTIGASKSYKKWVFGGRFSMLYGLANVQFNPDDLSIQIQDSTYAHTFSANAVMNTAGIPRNKYNEPDFEHVDGDWALDNYSSLKNRGYALSMGASYSYDSRTTFTVAISDLGFINWKDSVMNYRVKGNETFHGLDALSDWLYNRETNPDSLIEDFMDNFDDEKTSKSYRTWLAPKFYLAANYQIARRTHFGASFYAVYNHKFYPAFTISLTQGAGRFLNLLASVSANQRTLTNLGLGLVVKPGPFQIYVVADNLYPLINPLKFTNANIRIGMNLVFGRVVPPAGLPYR